MSIKDKFLEIIKPRDIKVDDIKAYIVTAYDEVRILKGNIEALELENSILKEDKMKYEASLVLLDEYKKRDAEKQSEIQNLKMSNAKKDDEKYHLNGSINTFKIEINQLRKSDKDRQKELSKLIKEKLINKILDMKGNLSKQKVVQVINDMKLEI